MKQTIICLLAFIGMVMPGCQKEKISEDMTTVQADENKNAAFRTAPTPAQLLVRDWIEWVFARDMSLDPNTDETGAKQYADQPFSSGTMMLGGASSMDLVNRSITIDIDQYQRVFIPLMFIAAWNNSCYTPNPDNGTVPFGSNNSIVTQALNGNRTLILKWDGVSLLPSKKYDLRENSGVWEFTTHTTWNEGCVDTESTVYADGIWGSIALTPGVHTLEIAGDLFIPRFKIPFSNHVIYTITVTN